MTIYDFIFYGFETFFCFFVIGFASVVLSGNEDRNQDPL